MTWLLTGEGIEICGGAGLMTVVRVGMTIYRELDDLTICHKRGGRWIDPI